MEVSEQTHLAGHIWDEDGDLVDGSSSCSFGIDNCDYNMTGTTYPRLALHQHLPTQNRCIAKI